MFVLLYSQAALAAVDADTTGGTLSVCLLEPTDWAGGQLTASAVSAIDYGPHNSHVSNQAKSWVSLMQSVSVSGSVDPSTGKSTNLGECWVSQTCYNPRLMLDGWITPQLASRSRQLTVFYNTVIKSVTVDPHTQTIVSITAITRAPITPPYNLTLSQELADWYTPIDSPSYKKHTIEISGAVFIDASEWGELMVLADTALNPSERSWTQGVEMPIETELSSPTPPNDRCGQETVLPFYIAYLSTPAPVQHFPPPPAQANYSFGADSWSQVWTYRRAQAAAPVNEWAAVVGDVSNQNWGGGSFGGNDWSGGYLFLSVADTVEQAQPGGSNWMGGVDREQLARAENNAYGFYEFVRDAAPATIKPNLWLDQSGSQSGSYAGTYHGLSKVPYVRDTRRSIGIDHDFRLLYSHIIDANGTNPANNTGYKFPDRIGLAEYLYTDIHRLDSDWTGCNYPDYLNSSTVKPFYLPFRALTNRLIPNLLVGGKTMAQSFHANGATRLHPVEWNSGLAAGVAATLMIQLSSLTTTQLYENEIETLQQRIVALGGVIDWTL